MKGNFIKKLSNKVFAIATTLVTAVSMISPLGLTTTHALNTSGNFASLYDAGVTHVGAGYSASNRLGPNTFDCSGFVDYLFRETGIDSEPYNNRWTTVAWVNTLNSLPYSDATLDGVSSINAKKGDLIVFFGDSSRSAASSQHIGVLADNNTMVSAINVGVIVQGLSSPIGGNQYIPAGSKNGTYVRVYHMPSDVTVKINLNKTSAIPDITNANKQYSLAGAVYGIYKTQADAQNNTNAIAQITTDANGKGSASVKVSGDITQLWYREVKAPTGYVLNPTANAFSAGNGNTNPLVNVSDDVARDPLIIKLSKQSEDNYTDAPSLSGAQFTIKYYDGQYSSVDQLPANATRTWVIETKEKEINGKKGYFAQLSDEYLVTGSDNLYIVNGSAVVPVGTITVEETKVPDAKFTDSNGVDHDVYSLNNKTLNGTNEITQADGKVLMNIKYDQGSTSSSANMWSGNEVSNEYTIKEKFNSTPYTVIKVDADTAEQNPQGNATLNGGSFEVINNNSYTINYNGTPVAPNERVATFSLVDGQFNGGSELPVGSYIVRELEAPEGYRLDGVIESTLEVTGTGTATVTLSDRVKKGGFKIQKQDIDTKTAEGDSDLTTVFRIINTGTNPVWVDSNGDGQVSADEMYANGATINLPASAVVTGTANGDGTFTTNSDGYFETVNNILPYSSYRIEEVTPPAGYKSDDGSITSTEFSITEEGFMQDCTNTIKNKVKKGGFKIQKQDMDTGLRTQGDAENLQTTFKITNIGTNPVWVDTNDNKIVDAGEVFAPGEVIKLPSTHVVAGKVNDDGTFTSNKDGYFEIKGDVLPYSTYRVDETIPPVGYKADDGAITNATFSIREEGQVEDLTQTIKNPVITGKFDIQKMLSSANNGMSTTSKPEAGVEFTALLKKTVDEKFGGDYKAAYKAIFGFEPNVEGNPTPDDSKDILNDDGSILFTTKEYDVVTTNNSGMAYSRDLAYGEYYIFQSSHADSVQDYVGNVTTYEGNTFKVSEEGQDTIHFYVNNVPTLYKIRMIKLNEQTGDKLTLNTATFRITDEDGNVVKQKIGNKVYDSFTTTTHQMVVDDAEGKKVTVPAGTFVSEQPSAEDEGISYTALGLEKGTYYINEIKTPDGFKTIEPIKIEIKESAITEVDVHGENIVSVDINNKQVTGGFALEKHVDEWDEADTAFFDAKDLSGVGFTLTATEDEIDPSNGNVLAKAGEKAVRVTGDKSNAHETINEFFVDKDGKVTIDGLPAGKYTLVETSVPDGLVLDSTKHSVEVKIVDQKAIVTIDGTQVSTEDSYDPYDIENKVTKISIKKTDITNSKEIPGVKMEVRHGDDVIDSWTSTDKEHNISGLKDGETYTLVETSTIPGYYYSENVDFTVSGEMTKVDMKDAPIVYQIEKVDENGNPVKGVTLELYDVTTDDNGNYINVDENGNPAKIELPNDGVTTGEPFVLDRVLEAGHNYKLVESEYVAGLYKATDIYFNVNMIGTSDTVTITMVDETADVVVRKVDENGNPIAGAKMQIIEAQTEPADPTDDSYDKEDENAEIDPDFNVDENDDVTDGTETPEAPVEDNDTTDNEPKVLDADDETTPVETPVEGDDKAEGTVDDSYEKSDETDDIDPDYTLPSSEVKYVPVKDENGNDKVIYEFTTTDDEKGVDISQYVKGDGAYILREVEAPYGYQLAQDQAFVVTGTAATCQVLIAVDMPESYYVSVKKVDKADHTKTLEGATFKLYNKADDTVALDANDEACVGTSDKDGIVTFNVNYSPEGYYVKETKAPDKYNINNNKFDVNLSDDFFEAEEKVYEIEVEDEAYKPTGIGLSTGIALGGLGAVAGLCGSYSLKKKKNKDEENAE